MEQVILIKYGELTTKKGNRNFFVKTLTSNLCEKLKAFDIRMDQDMARMYIHFKEEEKESILKAIGTVFGIHTYHVAYQCSSDLESIKTLLTESVEKEVFKTFKVEVKRSDKTFLLTSDVLAPLLGGIVLKHKKDVCVDVHHPDAIIHVEIRHNNTYIYYNAYHGAGGYPVGVQSKGLLMLSGGIDSPVAGYLAMKRGIVIEAVYFEAIPHTSLEAREKVIELCRKLCAYTKEIKLHIVPFTKMQEEIYKNVSPNYVITIMRRMMYRIMEQLCHQYHALAIINGESIGQVASQTLYSMQSINQVTSIPVIRPVACFDKLEIIDIAKKIDTYSISILPYEDCCTVFVPKHPVINPSVETCQKEEEKFDFTSLLTETVDNVFTIKVKKEEEKIYQDLL